MRRSSTTLQRSTSNQEEIDTPNQENKKSPFAIVIVLVILVAAVVLGVNGFLNKDKYLAKKQQNANVAASTPESIRELIGLVSKHIVIKSDEDPTVATIQDADLLRTQNPAFYKDAQNGDRLLVWSDKAVLYSASKDQLLYVLPINTPPSQISNEQVQAVTSSVPTEEKSKENATIEVRNGTQTAGLAKIMSKKIEDAGIKVASFADAKLKDYSNTVIIVNPEKELPETIKTLQTLTGGKISTLKEGEKASTADILVVVGADFSQ